MRDEIRNILSRIGEITDRNLIQTALLYLSRSQSTGRAAQKTELLSKKDEVKLLTLFAAQYDCWYSLIDDNQYIGEGAEQQVFLNNDGRSVTKINDAIFYESWKDYFVSLLIHNFLFPSTHYELLGFYLKGNDFYSVVKQSFIESTQPTDLDELRKFLERNGFKHRKNNDYYHPEWGIILEDLHDENVLTNHGVFFFIDTVIYLLP
jgi:hypothetical protein